MELLNHRAVSISPVPSRSNETTRRVPCPGGTESGFFEAGDSLHSKTSQREPLLVRGRSERVGYVGSSRGGWLYFTISQATRQPLPQPGQSVERWLFLGLRMITGRSRVLFALRMVLGQRGFSTFERFTARPIQVDSACERPE